MNYPKISLIAAIASGNRALGKDNDLIYKIPEDLARFKELTSGHPIIMGRKTFQSISRVLPNRTNIIITQNPDFKIEGAVVVKSIDEAINTAKISPGSEEIFLIGGANIFNQTIAMADKLYMTIVTGNPTADTFFPDYSEFKKIVYQEEGEWQGLKYKFLDLEK